MEENEKQNSCEISINSKGIYSGKLKNYSESLDEAYNITKKKAEELEKLIKEKNK